MPTDSITHLDNDYLAEIQKGAAEQAETFLGRAADNIGQPDQTANFAAAARDCMAVALMAAQLEAIRKVER